MRRPLSALVGGVSRVANMRCIPDASTVFHAQRGGCSTVDWQEAVADALPRNPPVNYVNVGANKGYRVPEFLALWSQERVVDYAQGWRQELLRYAQLHKKGHLKFASCGNCNDCKASPPASHNRSGARMHLLELAPANRALLAHMLSVQKLTDRVSLHPFGASNVTSQLTVFKGLMAGDERGHALTGAKAAKYKTYGAAEQVDAVALDDFFARQRLRSIYHVAIDTEGWDALVIEGMRTALMEKVREYHDDSCAARDSEGFFCLMN